MELFSLMPQKWHQVADNFRSYRWCYVIDCLKERRGLWKRAETWRWVVMCQGDPDWDIVSWELAGKPWVIGSGQRVECRLSLQAEDRKRTQMVKNVDTFQTVNRIRRYK